MAPDKHSDTLKIIGLILSTIISLGVIAGVYVNLSNADVRAKGERETLKSDLEGQIKALEVKTTGEAKSVHAKINVNTEHLHEDIKSAEKRIERLEQLY